MTAANYDNLSARAEQIRQETGARANTAQRVGSLLCDMVDSGALGGVVVFGGSPSASAAANSTALQAAMTAASATRSRIVVTPGTYSFSQEVSLPDGSFLDLEIQEGATLDFSQLTTLPAREACITVGTDSAGLIALPALSGNATAGDVSLSLASAPDLSPGDLFILCNSTDQSWNANLIDSRPYYHAGEYLRVRSVSGTTVNLDAPLYASYTAGANIELYKVTTNQVRIGGGGKIICPHLALFDVGIEIWNGYRSTVQDITITNARYSHINLHRCFDTSVNDVDSFVLNPGGNEGCGVFMISCFNTWVRGGSHFAAKHGVSLTGGAIDSAVPNTLCGAEGTTLRGTLTAADMHGHCRRCSWLDCTVEGGMSLGGLDVTAKGNTVRSASDLFAVGTLKGMCIRFREIKGGTLDVSNNTVYVDHLSAQSNGDYPCSFDTWEADSYTRVVARGLTIRGSINNAKVFYLAPQNVSTDELTEVVVDGVTFEGPIANKAPVFLIQGYATKAFRQISIANVQGLSIQSDSLRCRETTVRGVSCAKSDSHGMFFFFAEFSGVTQFLNILNCTARENDQGGIVIHGGNVSYNVYATVKGCVSLNNGQAAGTERVSLHAQSLTSLELSGNTWGDTQAVQTQTSLYSLNTVTTLLGSGNKALGATLLRSLTSVTNDREELTFVGTGTPEGAVTAPVGSLFIRKDGGAGTTRYFKESGTGNTGWVGK